MDIRYVDLGPDVPLLDHLQCQEIYADGVAGMQIHGSNFTTTYFTWATSGPHGLLQRVPVLKITRPKESLIGLGATFAALIYGNGIRAH